MLPKIVSIASFFLAWLFFKHSYGLGDDDVDEGQSEGSGAAGGVPPAIAMTPLDGTCGPC